jgi:hypothetical protein
MGIKFETLTTALALAVACVMVFVAVVDEHENFTASRTESINRELIIFSEGTFTDDVRNRLTGLTGNTKNHISNMPAKGDIVIIDELWLTATGKSEHSAGYIQEMLEANVPVIFVNGDSRLYDESVELCAYTSAGGSLAYGYYYDARGIPHVFDCLNGGLKSVEKSF